MRGNLLLILGGLPAISAVGMAGAAEATSPDLSRIPRVIARAPAFRAPEQRYCLLALGPEARSRVWLVLDGNDLYVDRNRNGNLTEPGERVTGVEGRFKVGDLVEADGKTRYRNVLVAVDQRHGTEEEGVTVIPFEVSMNVRGLYDMSAKPTFARTPAEAPIVHFGGALSMRVFDPKQVLRGQRVAFRCLIRTPGLGEGAEASISHYGLPEYAYPTLRMELPAPAGGTAPPPQTTELKTRCCGSLFLGSVRVPPNASPGTARIALAFPAWKEGNVQPSQDTVEVK